MTTYGCRTPPPDVVSGTDRCTGALPETDSTFGRPAGRTRESGVDRGSNYAVALSSSSASSSTSPLTSSTPRCPAAGGKPRRSASRHVDFLLDESTATSPPPCFDVTDDSSPIRPPAEFDVDQPAATTCSPCNGRQRRRTAKSMILIGEEDVDELFQPVNINGDSFALLQTPIRSFDCRS